MTNNIFRKDKHIDTMQVYSSCNNCLRHKESKLDTVVDGVITEKNCPLCGKKLYRRIVTNED